MSESISVFRITRIVRPGRRAAAAAIGVARGKATGAELSHLAIMAPTLIAAPELIPVVGLVASAEFLGAFYHPGLGYIWPDPNRPWTYSDKVRQATLEHVFGATEGAKVWHDEFRTRSINIDLRQRAP